MNTDGFHPASERPQRKGYYLVRVKTPDGVTHEFCAWHNPATSHWLTAYERPPREIGFADRLKSEYGDTEGNLVSWAWCREELRPYTEYDSHPRHLPVKL